MQFSAEATSDGVTQRLFEAGDAPGVVWAPAHAAGPRPLILLGHGGGAHKTAPSILARARRYVTGGGYAVAALDAPGWGGRPVPAEYEPFNAEIEELTAAGKPLGDAFARRGVIVAALAIPEWQAAIDGLTSVDWIGAGRPDRLPRTVARQRHRRAAGGGRAPDHGRHPRADGP